jgi:hypothetical protein
MHVFKILYESCSTLVSIHCSIEYTEINAFGGYVYPKIFSRRQCERWTKTTKNSFNTITKSSWTATDHRTTINLLLQAYYEISSSISNLLLPGDLGTRKRPGTSCKIEIHFWFKITQYLINGIRFLFQICPRHSFPCARHRHKVSNPSPFAHRQITWYCTRQLTTRYGKNVAEVYTFRNDVAIYCTIYKHRIFV